MENGSLEAPFGECFLDLQVEQEVWRVAQVLYGRTALSALVEEALRAYRRSPGYSPVTRLHVAQIGVDALRVLSQDPHGRRRLQVESGSCSYVEVRMALRTHLYRYLLQQVFNSPAATESLMEAHLAMDVGL
ncbi:hypothetical protein [Pseudomonas putida]|uniref:hypothetical protein n=1 Tax=Pseudomonas putida TaxID=303 RepID=UPI00059B0EFD|nr:hypothetical protein [Pseudomonas putida]